MRVLLITVDDISKALLGASVTPNIDRLRNQGMSFKNFWAGPNCSGHRARRESGLQSFEPGNLVGTIVKEADGYELPAREGRMLAHRVRGDSFFCGKWHLGNRNEHPIECGYTEFVGTLRNLGPDDYFDWEWSRAHRYTDSDYARREGYVTTWVVDVAIDAIKNQGPSMGFSFINVNFHAAHKPRHVPPQHLHTQGPFLPTVDDKAKAMVEALDTELGRLFAVAFDHDMLVLLCSDNGAAVDLGGAKGSLYENGINTFLIAATPGGNKGETRALTSVLDIYGTVIDATGGEWENDLERMSLMPLIVGDDMTAHNFVYTEKFSPLGKAPEAPWSRAVRNNQFKLIENADGTEELYDLVNDPWEDDNLVDDERLSEVLEAMRERIA